MRIYTRSFMILRILFMIIEGNMKSIHKISIIKVNHWIEAREK
jgi:hypothetical protein